MKLIKWNLHEDVEAYTTTRKLGDISLNNPNYLKVLENRQELVYKEHKVLANLLV